jgi:alpha-N-arabinofuranosidase
MYASASTAMHYHPAEEGSKAGLVAMQNDQYYYFLSVTRINGATVVQVEQHAGERSGGAGTVLKSAPWRRVMDLST